MKKLFFVLLLFWVLKAEAQIQTASLQASGLTCSMCSKAVKTALEAVPFVEKVSVDIKNQQYNLTFKKEAAIEFDALDKAVQDAGFSVASLSASALVNKSTLQKDEHVTIGGQTVHFLNADGRTVDGQIKFTVVDKGFVTAKDFKKYAAMTKMACVQTGRMASCCSPSKAAAGRIYHVII